MIKAINRVKNIDDIKSVNGGTNEETKNLQTTKGNGVMAIKVNFSNLWLPGS